MDNGIKIEGLQGTKALLTRDLCGHACRQDHLIPCPSPRNAIRAVAPYRGRLLSFINS
jgi:hypothetical protein